MTSPMLTSPVNPALWRPNIRQSIAIHLAMHRGAMHVHTFPVVTEVPAGSAQRTVDHQLAIGTKVLHDVLIEISGITRLTGVLIERYTGDAALTVMDKLDTSPLPPTDWPGAHDNDALRQVLTLHPERVLTLAGVLVDPDRKTPVRSNRCCAGAMP